MRPLDALRRARVGDKVLVRHVGDPEWHERLITAIPNTAGVWFGLSPGEDHYAVVVEEDYEEVEFIGPRDGVPQRINKG